MRCRKCHDRAVIYMRHHKLALCKNHYIEWFPLQTERVIRKFKMFKRDDTVLVAVSGGKDSLALWDILLRLGYKAEGLYLDLGINTTKQYSKTSLEMIKEFVSSHNNPPLHVEHISHKLGVGIPEITELVRRGSDKPCSICGLIKRHEINRIARQYDYPVVATGHNLDDEVAVLFQNTLQWQTEYLRRQYPVLQEEQGLVRKVKPFCRFYERETAAYALLRNIKYIYEECPFSTGASTIFYKEFLNTIEEKKPGAKLNFYLSFMRAKKRGDLFPAERDTLNLQPCTVCGQPTSAPEYCSFCRLQQQLRKQIQRTSPQQ